MCEKNNDISKEVGYHIAEASDDEVIPLKAKDDDNQKLIIFDDNIGEKIKDH